MPVDGSGRLDILQEIGRGGMGAVYWARDRIFGRDVAMKIIAEEYAPDPTASRRFLYEARITGQLEHPGIVPVHEMGTCIDGRPYFTMKLVRGKTLQYLLAVRNSPTENLPHFLGIFEKICQAMAYAHVHRIIHRDLKPSNVMVGEFGEIQVMDWGLAKNLADPVGPLSGLSPEMAGSFGVSPAEANPRLGWSQPGMALGTPSYMAPEQSRGDLHLVDARSDVFSLGSILWEILTGLPAIPGHAPDPRQGLSPEEACAVDSPEAPIKHDLFDLAYACLAPRPEDRPPHAGIVAERITAYQASIERKYREAEIARVAERTRALESDRVARAERQAKRRTKLLAASLVVLIAFAAGITVLQIHQRLERRSSTRLAVETALTEMTHWRERARSMTVNALPAWDLSLAAAEKAQAALSTGEPDAALSARVTGILSALRAARSEAEEKDRRNRVERVLMADLDNARDSRADRPDLKDWAMVDDKYAAAFRTADLDVDKLDAPMLAARIARFSSPVEIALYLDDWAAANRQRVGPKEAGRWKKLVEIARAIDPDPWRDTLRGKVGTRSPDALETVCRLADNQQALEDQPAASLVLLARQLRVVYHDYDRAEKVLRTAWSQIPNDFWVCFELGMVRSGGLTGNEFANPEEAIRYLSAAVAIRPESSLAHDNLGLALLQQRRPGEAIAHLNEALRLRPDSLQARFNLVQTYIRSGRLDEAVKVTREITQLRPDLSGPHNNLALILGDLGRYEEADAEFREALRISPANAGLHNNIGVSYAQRGDHERAIVAFREAVKIQPSYHRAWDNLVHSLSRTLEFNEAIDILQRTKDRLRDDSTLRTHMEREIVDYERIRAQVERLPDLLSGKFVPKSTVEKTEFAYLCSRAGYFVTSARLYLQAHAEDPQAFEDADNPLRFHAACALAQAGHSKSRDEATPDEDERGRFRAQALAWLRTELRHRTLQVQAGPPAMERLRLRRTIVHWLLQPEFACVRGEALTRLSENERWDWQEFWKAVEAFTHRAYYSRPQFMEWSRASIRAALLLL